MTEKKSHQKQGCKPLLKDWIGQLWQERLDLLLRADLISRGFQSFGRLLVSFWTGLGKFGKK
jgi:hypothetical protein